jgi:thiol-disulfide isomerase/thioredoxin
MNTRLRLLASFVATSMAVLLVGCGPTYQADSTDAENEDTEDTVVAVADGDSDAAAEAADESVAESGPDAGDASAEEGDDSADRSSEDDSEAAGVAEEADEGEDEDEKAEAEADEGEEASAPTLSIGSKAPALAIADWVTGEPIKALEADQIHVVEFWATWCGPCRRSMPHISKLQDEYGDKVKFIGVTDESRDIVEEFLGEEQEPGKLWKDVITYRLAIDEEQATNKAYMLAAGERGIPTAFVVGRDGHIEWIGHPASIDGPLKKIVDGDWDRSEAIAARANAEKMQSLIGELQGFFRGGKWDEALAKVDEFEKATGESAQLTLFRLAILQAAGRPMDAAAQVTKLIDLAWDDSQALNQVAWGIATGQSVGNMEQAERAAIRASELTTNSDAAILDTLARVYYEKGELDKAIEWQQKAVDNDKTGNPEIAAAFAKYQDEKAGKSSSEEPKEEPAEDSTDESAPEEPAAEEPAAEAPEAEAPATEEPVAEAPATEEPATEEPATEEPATP